MQFLSISYGISLNSDAKFLNDNCAGKQGLKKSSASVYPSSAFNLDYKAYTKKK